MPENTVLVKGYGPHVRFKTTVPHDAERKTGYVKIVTNRCVKSVPLNERTSLTFIKAAS